MSATAMTTESTISPSQGSSARGIPVRDEQAFLNDQAQAMRAGVYQLLARLFAREPDQELLDTLAGIGEVAVSYTHLTLPTICSV